MLRGKTSVRRLLVGLVLLIASGIVIAKTAAGHADPIAPVILGVTGILFFAVIGRFAAGVILHDAYFHQWGKIDEHQFSIRDLIAPLEVILVPIFFVLMGVQVKLETFADMHVVLMAGGLILAAIIGKVISGFGASRKTNRVAIGIGMMPRGEVGLVFASIGKSLEVFSDELFSALVLMVIVTTLLTPPFLKLALFNNKPTRNIS